jgi:L-fucose isomerase-like protein
MAPESSGATDRKSVLGIAWVAHKGAGADTGNKAEEFIKQLLPPEAFVMTDRLPDIILFMSGGSEQRAISLMQPEHPVLLLSIRGNNAYASATEVMAWMVNNKRFAMLADALDARESGLIDRWRQVAGAWHSLRGMRAGLIGSVSEWLVASNVPAGRLLEKFGVTLVEIPWNTLPDYKEQKPDPTLLNRFSSISTTGLVDASRVLTLLRQVVAMKSLSAIAVECFSLVQQRKVTACLALAQLNNEGLVAACEGDLASMAGMMLLKALTGSVPWMANTTRITENTLILSHCTAAFDLVTDIKLATHYETDCSLAVKGTIAASEVTVFRLSESLDRAFIVEGKVVSHPGMSDACRTQVEVELPSQALNLLKTQPLGNHLLMSPGKHAGFFRLACTYRGIMAIE